MPVIPATWEAETGELLEPGRQRLQRAEIAPLPSSLGNRARLCLGEKKGNKSHVIYIKMHIRNKFLQNFYEYGKSKEKSQDYTD